MSKAGPATRERLRPALLLWHALDFALIVTGMLTLLCLCRFSLDIVLAFSAMGGGWEFLVLGIAAAALVLLAFVGSCLASAAPGAHGPVSILLRRSVIYAMAAFGIYSLFVPRLLSTILHGYLDPARP